MTCQNCGNTIADGSQFCTYCGFSCVAPAQQTPATPEPVYQQPVQQSAAVPNQYYYQQPAEITENTLPSRFKPLGAWTYFGLNLLFALPLIGFILLIVFSFDDSNINRRNYARSFWCAYLIAAIIAVVIIIFALILGGGIFAASSW